MKEIRRAIRRLDYEALSKHQLHILTEHEIDDLLLLSDDVVVREIAKASSRISKAKNSKIPRMAYTHAQRMLHYLSVRALLCGESTSRDTPDLEIY